MESRIKQLKEDITDANQRHEQENMRFEEQVTYTHIYLYIHTHIHLDIPIDTYIIPRYTSSGGKTKQVLDFTTSRYLTIWRNSGVSRDQTGSRGHRTRGEQPRTVHL